MLTARRRELRHPFLRRGRAGSRLARLRQWRSRLRLARLRSPRRAPPGQLKQQSHVWTHQRRHVARRRCGVRIRRLRAHPRRVAPRSERQGTSAFK